jgi:hypothetical protein
VVQFPKGPAALITGYSDDGIRLSATIPPASAFLTVSLFQNRFRRQIDSSFGKEPSAAFVMGRPAKAISNIIGLVSIG